MQTLVSLSSSADVGKQILFDMIQVLALHETGIDFPSNIKAYKYLGVKRGNLLFVVAAYVESEDESHGGGYAVFLLTFDLEGHLKVSDGSIPVANFRDLEKVVASAKPSDFD